jgi:hypothetical protein
MLEPWIMATRHRMGFDRRAVVGADVDVDAQHPCIGRTAAGGVELQHGGRENERAAVGDARLDDQLGLRGPDDLLHGHHVLGVLDDGPAQPFEVVGVLALVGLVHPGARGLGQGRAGALGGDFLRALALELFVGG